MEVSGVHGEDGEKIRAYCLKWFPASKKLIKSKILAQYLTPIYISVTFLARNNSWRQLHILSKKRRDKSAYNSS